MFKLFRSVKDEICTPLEGQVTGDLPEWLEGSLYRNGAGLFEVGSTKYFHWFDGMALLQRFHIKNGKVTYQRRFLKSETYKANMKANRIVVAEFGTRAYPDPNANVIVRLFSKISFERSDNCPVNILRIGEELFAVSQSNYMHRFDPVTLETVERLDLSAIAQVSQASAHFQYDPSGDVHNIGFLFGAKVPKYCLFTITPDASKRYEGNIVAELKIGNKMHPSYMHSFAMTEHYYIFIEQPLVINVWKIASAELRQIPISDCLEWKHDLKTRFHVVDRKSGKVMNSNYVYEGPPFMLANQGNAFEVGDTIVLDIFVFKDRGVLDSYFMKNLIVEVPEGQPEGNFPPSAYQRFILPLNLDKELSIGSNLPQLDFTTAVATKASDTKLTLTPELLSDIPFEMPVVNDAFRRKRYRFVYGVTFTCIPHFASNLIKFDVETRSCIEWKEEKCFPSQPCFLPSPNAETEDDGVLIATVNSTQDDKPCFLLILCAKTMTELCRVIFPVWIPRDLHGLFVREK